MVLNKQRDEFAAINLTTGKPPPEEMYACWAVAPKLLAKLGEGGQVGDYNTVGEILEAVLPDLVQIVFPKRFFFPRGNHSLISYNVSSRKLS